MVDPGYAEIYDFPKGEDLGVGDAVYLASDGKIYQADANVAGEEQFLGIVARTKGFAATVLKKGRIRGFDLSGMDYFDLLYLSNAAGNLADAASVGGMTVIVGKVVPVAEAGNPVKVAYIYADWLRAWS